MYKKLTTRFKNNLNHIIQQYKSSRLFRNIILSYAVIGCITIIIFSFVIQFGISKASKDYFCEINVQSLTQASNTGNYIVEGINKTFLNDMAGNEVLVSAMHKVMLNQNERIRLYKYLSDMVSTSPLIDSIYVMNLNSETVYSTIAKETKMSDFCDQEIVTQIKETQADIPRGTKLFPRTVSLTLNSQNIRNNTNYISIIFKPDKDSVLVVNVLQDEFQKLVSVSPESEEYQKYVIDNKGTVIIGAKEKMQNQLDNVYNYISESDEKSGVFTEGRYTVCYAVSDYLDYIYCAIYKTSSLPFAFNRLITNTIVLSVLFVILSMLLAVFLSERVYSPFRKIMKTVYNNDLSQIMDEEDEVGKIVNDISEMNSQYKSLQRVKDIYTSNKMNKMLQDVLLDRHDSIDRFRRLEKRENKIIFKNRNFSVLLADVNIGDADFAIEPNLLNYGIMNMGMEIIGDLTDVYAVDLDDEIAFVLNYNDSRVVFDNIESKIRELQKVSKELFEVDVTISVDNNSYDFKDIAVSYKRVKHAMLYKLVYEARQIIYYDDIASRTQVNAQYPQNIEKAIIENMNAQELVAMENKINEFFEVIKGYDYNTIFMYVATLIISINQSLKNTFGANSDIEINVVTVFREVDSIDELSDIIVNYCLDANINISVVETDKKDLIAEDIKEYIDKNYSDTGLSVESIAENIGYSTNYIRTIFKNVYNVSVSTYIKEKRFDEIYRLLEETDMNVKDVCEQAGLIYGGYFHSVFKKRTGLSPEKYRVMKKKK